MVSLATKVEGSKLFHFLHFHIAKDYPVTVAHSLFEWFRTVRTQRQIAFYYGAHCPDTGPNVALCPDTFIYQLEMAITF
jgi:hypothetical protein